MKIIRVYLLLFLSIISVSKCVFAQTSPNVDNLQVEQIKQIERSLMAPCCWGSTLAEHSSTEALAIKEKISQLVKDKKTTDQILDYFSKEYGERILSSPKKSGFNWFAWIFPALLFFFGSLSSAFILRKWTHPRENIGVSIREPEELISKDEQVRYRQELEKDLLKE